MKVECTNCERGFDATPSQSKLIERLTAAGAPLAMLECPHCGLFFGIALRPSREEETPYRCPMSGCAGWVSYVTLKRRRPFYGCGECGCLWKTEADVFAAISAVVKRYPYRRKSYVRKDGRWLPGDPKKEARSYEERTEREPKEFKD